MAEYAGLAFAAFDLLLKSGVKTYEIIQNDRYMTRFARKYMGCLYENDQTDLELVCNQARGILRDQTVAAEHKIGLERVSVRAKESLEAVHAMAAMIDSGALGFWGRNLRKLNRKIDDMGASMSQFRQIVESLRMHAAAESDLFLLDQDFAVTGSQQDVVELNDRTCIVNGQVSPTRSPEFVDTTRFILEAKSYTKHDKRTIKKDMRILSSKLEAAKKGQCILPLVGFRDNPDTSEYQFVFGVSAGDSTFQTLEARYRTRQMPSLNLRIALCRELAKAVLQTHTLALVHKHIRPANILLQSTETGGRGGAHRPALFLSGWQYARTADERASRRLGEYALERAMYQHPERQHLHAEATYCMAHDIYSLGVCMLELLTWSPLVVGVDAEEDGGVPEVALSQAYRDVFVRHEWNQGGGRQGAPSERQLWEKPAAVKRTIARMNEALVPVAAGDRMKEAIEMCLTCLDDAADREQFMAPDNRNNKEVVVSFVDTVLCDINLALSAV